MLINIDNQQLLVFRVGSIFFSGFASSETIYPSLSSMEGLRAEIYTVMGIKDFVAEAGDKNTIKTPAYVTCETEFTNPSHTCLLVQ